MEFGTFLPHDTKPQGVRNVVTKTSLIYSLVILPLSDNFRLKTSDFHSLEYVGSLCENNLKLKKFYGGIRHQ